MSHLAAVVEKRMKTDILRISSGQKIYSFISEPVRIWATNKKYILLRYACIDGTCILRHTFCVSFCVFQSNFVIANVFIKPLVKNFELSRILISSHSQKNIFLAAWDFFFVNQCARKKAIYFLASWIMFHDFLSNQPWSYCWIWKRNSAFSGLDYEILWNAKNILLVSGGKYFEHLAKLLVSRFHTKLWKAVLNTIDEI